MHFASGRLPINIISSTLSQPTISGLEFLVTTCHVHDRVMELSFPILDDTCPSSAVSGLVRTDNPTDDYFGMEYVSFAFSGIVGINDLEIECDVSVCKTGTGHCQASTDC